MTLGEFELNEGRTMGLSFTAVDFETANGERGSVCAVGAVKVLNGHVTDTYSALVRPPADFGEFAAGNIRVHGIREADVVDAPEWPHVYRELHAFAGNDVLVGHNAAFDVSVLLNACSAYDIDWPELDSFCTLRLSKAALTMPSYSLPWVVEHLELGNFNHHDPVEDAAASAKVLLKIAERSNSRTFADLLERFGTPLVRTIADHDEAIISALDSAPDAVAGVGFEGEYVCFTGTLKSMIRDEARLLVAEHGGTAQPGVGKKTTILVTGDFDSHTFRPGADFSSKLQKAFDLVEAGQLLEIVTEEDFVARLSLGEEQLRERLALSGGGKSRAPSYVLEQARFAALNEDGYWKWYRTSLASPYGRAVGGEECVWCSREVKGKVHWIYRERHVCSGGCNEKLKRAAKRIWANNNIQWPAEEMY